MIKNLKSKTDLSGFYVVYDGTVANETDGIFGISHLIEHLMCKGVDYLLDDLERNGIDWNAYTSAEHINFFMSGLDEYVSVYRDRFLDCFLNFDITKERFEKERKVILQEYREHFSGQSNCHFYNSYRRRLNYYHVIGRFDDLENITYEDCMNYYNKYYKNPSKIYNISKMSKYKRDLEFNTSDKKVILTKGIYDVDIEKFNISHKNISLLYLSDIILDDFACVNFITFMLSKGTNSPFMKETRDKYGNVYYMHCGLEKLTTECGIVNISTETIEDNVVDIKNTIGDILLNKEKYLSLDRFETILKYCNIYYKKLDINRHVNMSSYMTPGKWQLKSILKTITLDKVHDVFDKYFNVENFTISIDKDDF